MKEITIIALLHNIKEKKFVGAPAQDTDIADAINFVIDKQLVTRTNYGNFEISNTGLELLHNNISWNSLFEDEK